jgi:hypothetical protein
MTPAAQAPPTPRRIDIHQHFVSPSFIATLSAKNAVAPVPGFAAWKGYSPARAVETLDRVGVATAMLSITAPGVWFGDAQEARTIAREMNEYATAKMVGDYPVHLLARGRRAHVDCGPVARRRDDGREPVAPARAELAAVSGATLLL